MMLLSFAFLYLAQLCVVFSSTPSYFYVTAPTLNASWTNNGRQCLFFLFFFGALHPSFVWLTRLASVIVNVVKWVSAKEGIANVDMQLVRLSVDGVLPIAQASMYSISSTCFPQSLVIADVEYGQCVPSYSPDQLGWPQHCSTGHARRVRRLAYLSGCIVVTAILLQERLFYSSSGFRRQHHIQSLTTIQYFEGRQPSI